MFLSRAKHQCLYVSKNKKNAGDNDILTEEKEQNESTIFAYTNYLNPSCIFLPSWYITAQSWTVPGGAGGSNFNKSSTGGKEMVDCLSVYKGAGLKSSSSCSMESLLLVDTYRNKRKQRSPAMPIKEYKASKDIGRTIRGMRKKARN